MDSASCGPSNAIQNLNKHTQRDTSLQHQRLQQATGGSSVQQFRQGKQHIDPRLNNEFQQFNSGGDFASSFMNQMHIQPKVQHHHPVQQQQQQNGGWVNDFSNLSIQQTPQAKSDWQQQFMQQNQNVTHHHQHQHQPQVQQSNFQQMTPNYALGNSYQMRSNVVPMASPVFQNQSEHQQSHKLEEEQRRFENEFALIEKHLAAEQQQQQQEEVNTQEVDIDNIAKEKFAETARLVEDTIKSKTYDDFEMKKKFENSQFLKLMSSIGNRKVELEGDKLVTSDSKEDIREKGIPESEAQTAFASHQELHQQATLNNPDYHQPMFDQTPESSRDPTGRAGVNVAQQPVQDTAAEQENPQENRLPDPLAHIQDGQLSDINDPLTAAKVISGGQVQTKDWIEDFDNEPEIKQQSAHNERPFRKGQIVDHHWDEMYHDYRHDDDYY